VVDETGSACLFVGTVGSIVLFICCVYPSQN
jgi:hypothetical protein